MAVPMTFLQLVQRLRREVGAAGTGPTSVLGLSPASEYQRLVDYISTVDEDVQRLHDNWRFMVGNFTINTTAGKGSYLPSECVVPVTDLRVWKMRTLKCYLLAGGVQQEYALTYIDYDVWYALYNTAAPSNGQPEHYTFGDNHELLIGPAPADVYRISGKYQRTVATLTADASTPIYPAEFHLLPVWGAMMEYGSFTGAIEVIQRGQLKYNRLLREMERSELPRMNAFIPLA